MQAVTKQRRKKFYEASYKTYLLTGKVLPFCTLVAMLLHMVWNTGVLAIIIPAFLWILSASNYCRCCVTEKKRKTCEVNESLKYTYNTIMEVPAASAPPFLPGKGSIPFGGCQNIDWLRACLKKSFLQSARPTLRDISPEFSCRSPLRRPHPGEISHKL